MPSVGVVIPTRDRAALLRRAVDSAAGADQVVVVDDASPTYTPEFVDEMRSKGVEYVRLDAARGPGIARNIGMRLVRTQIVFFLDDDDFLIDGGLDRVRYVVEEHPQHMLYLHNCRFSDGATSVEPSLTTSEISFDEWVHLLASLARTEFKPAVRTSLFESDQFDDTGASGEGLLWTRVIRRYGAVLSYQPIVFYDVERGRPRLTGRDELLSRAAANARIASAWLEEIGPATRAIDARAWERLVIRAATYSALAARPFTLAHTNEGMSLRTRLLVRCLRHAPPSLVSLAFRLRKSLA